MWLLGIMMPTLLAGVGLAARHRALTAEPGLTS
jgi:hypothetical protein